MKQAVLFDFWDTLFSDTNEIATFSRRKELVAEYLREQGIAPPANLDAAFDAVRPWFREIHHKQQRTASVEERISWVLDYCGIKLEPDLLKPLAYEFGEMGVHLNPAPAPYVSEMLELLSRFCSLGIVSDTGYTPGRVLRKQLARHGLLDWFQAFSFSDETGYAKPHPASFRAALEPLGVEPKNAIHCGDLPEVDILGAKNLGITAVLYTGFRAAQTDGIPADYIISDWLELPSIVRKVFA